MKKRKDIDKKYKWDFSEYFLSDEAWESSFNEYSKEIKKANEFNGKLKDKKSVLKCLKYLENLDLLAEPLYIYAHCLSDVDVSNAHYQGFVNKIQNKLTEHSVATSFITPQLSSLPQEMLEEMLKDDSFKNYTKVLKDIIREKKYTLSEECEKILSRVSSFSRDFDLNFSNFENGDLKFKKVKDKNGKLLPMDQNYASLYLRGDDEVLRENAQKELMGAFGRYNNFLTSNYLGSVKKDVFYATTRGFNSALESSLFYEDVSSDVYNMLLNSVDENLNLEHKFFDLKKKLLGLKVFRTCDTYYNSLKSKKKYEYEQGFDIVCNALNLLGEEYIEQITKMKDTNKIDVFPNENKNNGAYKTGAYGKSPVVLTNFNGNFDDVSTLAHELGHAMHSYYSDKNQSLFNANYTIFLAEIASTVNETLLNNFMLENAKTNEEKLFYVNEFISRFHATVFRQTMFANFESKIHTMVENNEPLSSQILNDIYLDLVKKYHGKEVKVFDCCKFEWSRIPHFYSAFYVYKYATGLISAINIVENLKEGIISVDDYKKFLSSGCTNDPVSLLKIVKVDLTKKESFEKAFAVLERYLNHFENLI